MLGRELGYQDGGTQKEVPGWGYQDESTHKGVPRRRYSDKGYPDWGTQTGGTKTFQNISLTSPIGAHGLKPVFSLVLPYPTNLNITNHGILDVKKYTYEPQLIVQVIHRNQSILLYTFQIHIIILKEKIYVEVFHSPMIMQLCYNRYPPTSIIKHNHLVHCAF